MRLIDADAMLARLEEWNTSDLTDKALYNFTLHRILEQPTIEPSAQPEIVQCKDCKHNQLPATSGNANCEIFYGMTDQDGFCHMAERRTDDQT